MGPRSFAIRNILNVLGYAVVIIVALSISGVNPAVALAGGTVAGLVVGLGAQLVISNFFSGIVILATGFVKVGDDVRILNPSLPSSRLVPSRTSTSHQITLTWAIEEPQSTLA